VPRGVRRRDGSAGIALIDLLTLVFFIFFYVISHLFSTPG